MRQKTSTVIRMPRPTWTPTTDEQRAALDAIDQAVAKLAEARKRAEADVTKAETVLTEMKRNAEAEVKAAAAEVQRVAKGARDVKVPVREVVERTRVSRATVYRRLGKVDR